jgi:hypothetical protein
VHTMSADIIKFLWNLCIFNYTTSKKTHTWAIQWKLQPFIQLCLWPLNEICHHLAWYTVTSNPDIQSASVLCWLPKHKLDIPLLWYVQTTDVLPVYCNKSNIRNYVYYFCYFLTLIIFTIYYYFMLILEQL